MKLYRVVRGVLAGLALTALTLFGLWHILLWRFAVTYRLDNETATKGTP